MYGVPHPVAAIRSRIRQEFERHRYVNKLPVVDILLHKSNADYQVRYPRIGLSRVGWEMLGQTHLGLGQEGETTSTSGYGYQEYQGVNSWLILTFAGNYELLASDQPRHVLLQGGVLQGGEEVAVQFHHWVPRGTST
jgi:hypothetical protein